MSEKLYELTWCDIMNPLVGPVYPFETLEEVMYAIGKLPPTARWHLTFYPARQVILDAQRAKEFKHALLPTFDFGGK